MIAIIDYKLEEATPLLATLTEMEVDHHFTNKEEKILAADAVILPDTSDLKKAIRQLHLLNLFSMMRMLRKPILGIANGFELMCEFAGKNHAACLGLVPIDVQNSSQEKLNGFFSLEIVKQTSLLKNISKDDKFFFGLETPIITNDITTSKILGKEFSATIEANNFYGVLFQPEKSGSGGRNILFNFINLSLL